MTAWDAIVVGAGHNGLVAAATLAAAGKRVLVLEAQPQVGGLCASEELLPGRSASIAAHLAYALHPAVARSLKLPAGKPLATLVLGPEGRRIGLSPDGAASGVAKQEAMAWAALQRRLRRFAGALAAFREAPPPRLAGGGRADVLALARLGLKLRLLGRGELRELLRILLLNVQDLLDDTLSDELLKAALAWDALVGTHLAPRSPGGVLAWLYRLSAAQPLTLPPGGMTGLAEAMAAAARQAGCEIRTGAPVARILVEEDRVVGVALESGEALRAPLVLSSADPKRTLLTLLGARHLDAGMVRRVQVQRAKGLVGRLGLALDRLPPEVAETLATGRILLLDSLDALERSYDGAKYGEVPPVLAGELVAPALAQGGADSPETTATLLLTYLPTRTRDPEARTAIEAKALALLEKRLPGIGGAVRATSLWLPEDYEARLGLAGGHWHHGEITIDQLFMLRPVPGLAQYRTPVAGLWLCGAGAHPGGHVTGLPGRNAAKAALQEAKP